MNLDVREINVLIQALDAWEKEVGRSVLSRSLISAIVFAGREGTDEVTAKAEADIERAELESANRQEEAIMIKAKLIQARRELAAQGTEAFADALSASVSALVAPATDAGGGDSGGESEEE